MESSNKISCIICGKTFKNENYYLASHLRKHKLKIHEYCLKYYTDITSDDLNDIKCACKMKLAEQHYDYDNVNRTYTRSIKNRICNTLECKNWASNQVLGIDYDKKKYEHIGASAKYIALKHGISEKEAIEFKQLNLITIEKNNPHLSKIDQQKLLDEKIKIKKSKPFRTNLTDYTIRYGKKEGLRKYKERNKKISESNTIESYITKYGEVDGTIKYNEFIERTKKAALNSNISTVSKISIDKVYNLLIELGYTIESEKILSAPLNFNKKYFSIDFYLPNENISIEFFGDYWHANPRAFKDPNFMHKSILKTVKEIWDHDENRINYINTVTNGSVLVIWESTACSNIWSTEYLKSLIEFLKTNKTILKI